MYFSVSDSATAVENLKVNNAIGAVRKN